jgi:hypothetical protein
MFLRAVCGASIVRATCAHRQQLDTTQTVSRRDALTAEDGGGATLTARSMRGGGGAVLLYTGIL